MGLLAWTVVQIVRMFVPPPGSKDCPAIDLAKLVEASTKTMTELVLLVENQTELVKRLINLVEEQSKSFMEMRLDHARESAQRA